MKKFLCLLLAAAMIFALAACGQKTTPVSEVTAPDTTAPAADTSAPAAETTATAEKKIFYTYLSGEVDTLNGMNTVQTGNDTPLSYCSAYLWRAVPDESGTGFHFVPDLASEMPIQIDDTTWQVKIREEACWHNGDPINADTFMFTYKTLLDPIAVNAMAGFLADNNIVIVNGTEYMLQGDSNTVAWEDVGIKKIDDYTLEFKIVDPVDEKSFCTHFTNRALQPVYEPLYTANLSSDGLTCSYGTDLDKFMGCGPYFFTTWNYDSIQVYEKNPDYWLADLFHYDEVQVRIVPEANSLVELFESGQLDSFTPDVSSIVTYLDDPRLVAYPSTMVYHFDLNGYNPNNPLCLNNNYRKAIYLAMDRETIARSIWGNMEPAATYVNGMAGILNGGSDGVTYRETEYGEAVYDWIEETYGNRYGYNPELAKEYMQKAFEECGLDWDTDVITLQCLNSNGYPEEKRMCEFFLEEFPKIFDGRVLCEPNVIAEGMALDYIVSDIDKWDLSFMDWSRSLSRTLPYQCYYYFLESYSAHPNNFFPAEFQEAWDACEAVKTLDYDTICQATQNLEFVSLETVNIIPVVQCVNYELFSTDLILPVETYIPGFGWGAMFGDKAQ